MMQNKSFTNTGWIRENTDIKDFCESFMNPATFGFVFDIYGQFRALFVLSRLS